MVGTVIIQVYWCRYSSLLTTKIGEKPQNTSIAFGIVSESLGSDNAGSLQKNPLLAIGTVKLIATGMIKTVKETKFILESTKKIYLCQIHLLYTGWMWWEKRLFWLSSFFFYFCVWDSL